MIRSENSQSPLPLPIVSNEKKPDSQNDFSLLLSMFNQAGTVEAKVEESPQFENIDPRPLSFVATTEIFSQLFAQPAAEKFATLVNYRSDQDVVVEVVHLPETKSSKVELSSGLWNDAFSGLTVGVLKNGQATIQSDKATTASSESTNKLFMMTVNDGEVQQVVEWGSFSTGYLSYASAAINVGPSRPTEVNTKPASGWLKPVLRDVALVNFNRNVIQPWVIHSDQGVTHFIESQNVEMDTTDGAFETDLSSATESMAAFWQSTEINREYLHILSSERGGFRLYYRNYFAIDNAQVNSLLFNLLSEDHHANLTEVMINGQKVQRGDIYAR